MPTFEGSLSDLPHFNRLWRDYLSEIRMLGSPEHVESNMEAYRGLYRAYAVGNLSGSCLFWYAESADPGEPQGLTLTGTTPSPSMFASDLGTLPGRVWGMYVHPNFRKQGAARELQTEGFRLAKEKYGWSHIHASVLSSNTDAHRLLDNIPNGVLADLVYVYPLMED